MKDLLKFLKNYKKELVFGPFFKLLEAIFELMVPMVMAKIIDKGIANGDTGYILRMSGLIVVLGVCGLGFALTCQFLAARCAYGFGTELREALYRHINSLSYESIDRIGTSSLVNRLTNDTNTVQNGVNMFISPSFEPAGFTNARIISTAKATAKNTPTVLYCLLR